MKTVENDNAQAISERDNLLMKREDLHPDLRRYLTRGSVGRSLNHPLVEVPIYTPNLNALLNKQYTALRDIVAKALAEKKWNDCVFAHTRAYRLDYFINICSRMADGDYWELLSNIWTDIENRWQYGSLIGSLLSSPRPNRDRMMNTQEKAFLAGLPQSFTIYRGHQGRRNRLGWSWTLRLEKARWFAKRFYQHGAAVVQATIDKNDVIAYLDGRKESEIIADPDTLNEIKTVPPK